MKNKNRLENEVNNWYDKIPKSLLTKYNNPGYGKTHEISVPFRCCIVGASGSRKTTTAIEILYRMNGTFGLVIICCMSDDEPLYKYLRTKIPEEQIRFYEGYDNIPELASLPTDTQILIIFDDLVLEKKQDKILQYFIRARKHGKSVSCMYLTQSYFNTPKIIRLNSNYIIVRKVGSSRDLNLMLRDFSLGLERDELFKMYEYATSTDNDFLMIDIGAEPDKKYRKSFFEIIKV